MEQLIQSAIKTAKREERTEEEQKLGECLSAGKCRNTLGASRSSPRKSAFGCSIDSPSVGLRPHRGRCFQS